MRQNAFVPRTPLESLQRSPRLTSWIWGGEKRMGMERTRDGKGTQRERNEGDGKGEERERKGI